MTNFGFDYFLECAELIEEAREASLFGVGTPASKRQGELTNELYKMFATRKTKQNIAKFVKRRLLSVLNDEFNYFFISKNDIYNGIDYILQKQGSTYEIPRDGSVETYQDLVTDYEESESGVPFEDVKEIEDDQGHVIRSTVPMIRYAMDLLDELAGTDSDRHVLSNLALIKFLSGESNIKLLRYISGGTADKHNNKAISVAMDNENFKNLASSQEGKMAVDDLSAQDVYDYILSVEESGAATSLNVANARKTEITGLENQDWTASEDVLSRFRQLKDKVARHNMSTSKGGAGQTFTADTDLSIGFIGFALAALSVMQVGLRSYYNKADREKTSGSTDPSINSGKLDVDYGDETVSIPTSIVREVPMQIINRTIEQFDKLQNTADGSTASPEVFEKAIPTLKANNQNQTAKLLETILTAFRELHPSSERSVETIFPKNAIDEFFPTPELKREFLKIANARQKIDDANAIALFSKKMAEVERMIKAMPDFVPPAQPEKSDNPQIQKFLTLKFDYQKKIEQNPNSPLKTAWEQQLNIVNKKLQDLQALETPAPEEDDEGAFGYMMEQVKKDRYVNPTGDYVDRGYKKPINLWHWSQINK
jgi:hypothetical protein